MATEYQPIMDGINLFTLSKINDDFSYLYTTVNAVKNGSVNFSDRSIMGISIAERTISGINIADSAIKAEHLAAKTITANKMADRSIGINQLAVGAVNEEKIGERAVTPSKVSTLIDSRTINKDRDLPLRSVKLGATEPANISILTKKVVLDARVDGAKLDKYYRISFIANGIVSNGKARYGITMTEHDITTGEATGFAFVFNDDDRVGNEQNANVQKLSDGIDTIIVDNGDLRVNLTVDRAELSASTTPTFLNLSSGPGVSPTAIIDRSNYSF